MVQAILHSKDGKKSGNVDLPDAIFGKKYVNQDVIHQAVVMYHTSQRQGNASTKERADVSGGGRKPFKQKGTGRARAGSNRSPLWHGGGTTFGPHPRNFNYDVPKKIKKAALGEAVFGKFKDDELYCVDDVKDSFSKTKEFVAFLKSLDLKKGKTLAVLDGFDESIFRSSKNIAFFTLLRAEDVNAFHILKNKNLLVSKTGLAKILDRVEK